MSNVNTVSQALRRIKELKGQINTVTTRMQKCFAWAETGGPIDGGLGIDVGKPTYDFHEVETERGRLIDELISLKARLAIANANNSITFEGVAMPVQEAVFLLAEFKADLTLMQGFSGREGVYRLALGNRFNSADPVAYVNMTYKVAITEKNRDKLVTKLAEKITALNAVIEDANHRTELP